MIYQSDVNADKDIVYEDSGLLKTYTSYYCGDVVLFKLLNQPGWPIEFVSSNIVNLLKYSKEEIESGHISYLDLVHPQDRNKLKKKIEFFESHKKVTASSGTYRFITKDKKIKFIRLNSIISRSQQGTIKDIQGQCIDITADLKSTEELKHSKLTFQTAFNICGSIHMIIDLETRKIIDVNKTFLKVMGYSRKEVVGQTAGDILQMDKKNREIIENDIPEERDG
ncbi:MAG: PAS domain-containing protein [Bacteroidota bacterium]|nr:PAS domain-containing protein [Bacteroidota bacterium]